MRRRTRCQAVTGSQRFRFIRTARTGDSPPDILFSTVETRLAGFAKPCSVNRCLAPTSVEKTILRRSLWRVSGVHKHFVARILDGVNGSEFLRFDWSCMTPVSNQDESREVLSACIDRAPIKRITWQRDRFLLIDNWKLLHGRGPAETVDTSRLHWRILLE